MEKGTTVVGRFGALALALVAAGGFIQAGPPADRSGEKYAEAPMQVQTEGLTVEEHMQRQAELSRRLLMELPKSAFDAPVRVRLSDEEVAAIDATPRSSSPLKIGLVKPLTPAIEIAGLSFGTESAGARRGTMGLAHRLPDGGAVWGMVVDAEGAGGLRLHLEGMSLPRGAELYLFTRDGEAFGPVRGQGPDGSGEFWTTTVFGSQAILALRVASPVDEAGLADVSFRVVEAGVITPRFVQDVLGASGPITEVNLGCGNPSCIQDAACAGDVPAAAVPALDATAKMEWVAGAFIYTCTGGLLSDNNPSQNNYFLTANHCLSKSNTAKNVQFYWRFRKASCGGSCPSNNGWPYRTTGSAVRATNRRGDFTLLQLNSNPPAGSVFLGWTNAPIANTNGADLFRISNPNFGPQAVSTHDVSTSAPTCSGWPRGERIYSRDSFGGTDGGSSGSPVLNSASQVVGQLSGGCGTNVNDPCDAVNNATVDGAFAYYYNTVQPFLNP